MESMQVKWWKLQFRFKECINRKRSHLDDYSNTPRSGGYAARYTGSNGTVYEIWMVDSKHRTTIVVNQNQLRELISAGMRLLDDDVYEDLIYVHNLRKSHEAKK